MADGFEVPPSPRSRSSFERKPSTKPILRHANVGKAFEVLLFDERRGSRERPVKHKLLWRLCKPLRPGPLTRGQAFPVRIRTTDNRKDDRTFEEVAQRIARDPTEAEDPDVGSNLTFLDFPGWAATPLSLAGRRQSFRGTTLQGRYHPMKQNTPNVEKLNLTVARRTLKRAIKNGEWKNAERIQQMIKAGSSHTHISDAIRTLESGRRDV